jgi:hypothetical protein
VAFRRGTYGFILILLFNFRKAQLLIEEQEREAELAKRSRPRDNSDFATMYNELNIWRQQETVKIKHSTLPGEERVTALNALLEHERKALQAIHRLKITLVILHLILLFHRR